MLRITCSNSGPETLVRPEGRLDEESFGELEAVCRELALAEKPFAVDLSGVSFVDRRGTEMLRALARAGVRLEGGSAFIRALLEEVRC